MCSPQHSPPFPILSGLFLVLLSHILIPWSTSLFPPGKHAFYIFIYSWIKMLTSTRSSSSMVTSIHKYPESLSRIPAGLPAQHVLPWGFPTHCPLFTRWQCVEWLSILTPLSGHDGHLSQTEPVNPVLWILGKGEVLPVSPWMLDCRTCWRQPHFPLCGVKEWKQARLQRENKSHVRSLVEYWLQGTELSILHILIHWNFTTYEVGWCSYCYHYNYSQM